jgi:hypothetical protein
MPDDVTQSHAQLPEIEIPPLLDARVSAVPRRAEDRTLVQRCKDLAIHGSQLVAIATAGVFAVGWFGSLVGLRVIGAPQASAAMVLRQDSIAARVARLEQGADTTRTQLRSLGRSMQFLNYQLCLRDNGRDIVAINRCRSIMEDVRGGIAP